MTPWACTSAGACGAGLALGAVGASGSIGVVEGGTIHAAVGSRSKRTTRNTGWIATLSQVLSTGIPRSMYLPIRFRLSRAEQVEIMFSCNSSDTP